MYLLGLIFLIVILYIIISKLFKPISSDPFRNYDND